MPLRRLRFYFRRPRARMNNVYSNAGKHGLLVPIIIALLVTAIAVYMLNSQLRPLIIEMASAKVSNWATEEINDAVNEEIIDQDIQYDTLITLEKDAQGGVSALKTNMAEINSLKSDITNTIIDKIRNTNTSDLKIPIGNIVSSDLFSGRGPAIPIKVISVGYAAATFSSEFTSAGINQTRHRIILNIEVSISILLAGYSTTTHVTTQMSIAETVIVGSVPDNYAYFGDVDSASDAMDDYYNFFGGSEPSN